MLKRKTSVLLPLGVALGCSGCSVLPENSSPEIQVVETEVPGLYSASPTAAAAFEGRCIVIRNQHSEIVVTLNDSPAAQSLARQLPLTAEVEDYSTNEKIFYPPEALETEDTPTAEGGSGVLAYYEPWGDVVLFYDDFRPNPALFALGSVTSGEEAISRLAATMTIDFCEGKEE